MTLMEMMPKPDPRQAEILPVVRYAASRKAAKNADYWDHATLLELAVLARDVDDANERLGDALMVAPHGSLRRLPPISGLSARCARAAARTPPGSSRLRRRSRSAGPGSKPPRELKGALSGLMVRS